MSWEQDVGGGQAKQQVECSIKILSSEGYFFHSFFYFFNLPFLLPYLFYLLVNCFYCILPSFSVFPFGIIYTFFIFRIGFHHLLTLTDMEIVMNQLDLICRNIPFSESTNSVPLSKARRQCFGTQFIVSSKYRKNYLMIHVCIHVHYSCRLSFKHF